MKKYKNKDGIELNYDRMSEGGRKGSGADLVQEVIREAVKISKQYNMWSKVSTQIALGKVREFLEVNFDLEEK
jgi:hypothetical protein